MVRRLAVVVAVLSLGLVGCSGSNDSGGSRTSGTTTTTTAAAGGGDAVAWAEQVCAVVAPESAALSAGPDIDPSDPAKAKTNMVAYLDTLVSALDRMIGGVRAAGAPPVPDGQAAADTAIKALDGARTTVGTAKTNFEKADASTVAGLQTGLLQVSQDLGKLGDLDDPTKGLRGNQELNRAFEQAPSCKKLSGSTPTS
ncbi:hypothetical protein [Actinokineospora sp.]|uniref:hypothetical protein n=1 Tax=Actinokineospora sp. TaxID=1872133 RepID=UPI00403849DC